MLFFFQKLFPLSAASPRRESFFSKPQNELPLVAVFRQEKIALSPCWLSATIGASERTCECRLLFF